jgi:hypothetical protein
MSTAEPVFPSESPAVPAKSRGWIVAAIVLVVALDIAFFWQRMAGAEQSEFGAHPDEAAHFVTGLFVRDAAIMVGQHFTVGGHGSLVQEGREFAEDYYTHYPKVSLGVWPPFFYLVQAAWTLPFSPSRLSILLLLCVLAALVAVLTFRALRDEFGVWPAAGGTVLLLTLPLFREYYSMVMAETLSALLMFAAMLSFGAFLDRERRGDVLCFGLFAALAILTKGTGLALALAAPMALVFARKLHLLKRPALWFAVLIVVLLAGPWTWATRHLGQGGWVEPSLSWHFTREALPYYLAKFGRILGLMPLVLFCVGVAARVRTATSSPGRWAAVGALIIGVIVFQSLIPVGFEARHLIPTLPAAVMFIVAGGVAIVQWARSRETGPDKTSMALRVLPWILAISTLACVVPLQAKSYSGFGAVTVTLLDEAGPDDVFLVSSDARGEGMFISEVALRETRPGHVIQRASKALATSSWSGGGYAPKFATDDDLLDFLTSGKIQYLILDDAVPEDKRQEHHEQLHRLLTLHPDAFWLVAGSELVRNGEPQPSPLKVYRIQRRN